MEILKRLINKTTLKGKYFVTSEENGHNRKSNDLKSSPIEQSKLFSVDDFREFLNTFPEKDGIICFSDERLFQHDEGDYDAQYNSSTPSNDLGVGVLKLLRFSDCQFGKPAIEIGCGTGIVSKGLLSRKRFDLVIVSDPSPKFVNISRRKLVDIPDLDQRARFAIFLAEDLEKLPLSSLSAIVMRSVLHHILDIDKFLKDAAQALTSGGCLVVEEPCLEGYVLMGAIAQFIPVVMSNLNQDLSEEQVQQVQLFVDTMKFYADRTVDKSTCEDKHIFRVDELMAKATENNMSLSFYPNVSLASFKPIKSKDDLLELKNLPFSFSKFFISYVKYCMQFEQGLVDKITNHLMPYLSTLDEIAAKGSSPYTTGVFVFKKL